MVRLAGASPAGSVTASLAFASSADAGSPTSPAAADQASVAIAFERVVAGYGPARPGRGGGGGRTILHDVSVQFPAGLVSAVVGPNGCGKSTLVRCAALGLPVRAGRVMVAGHDVARLAGRERARLVAVMPQGAAAPDIEVEQLVLGGRYPHRGLLGGVTEADRAIARDALAQAGCARLAGRNVRTLSGGERQRVYLALVLAQQTGVAVLDEPTAYLDPAASFELMAVAGELRDRGVAVVAVLHDLPLAFSHADRIAVMRAGRIEAFGTPEHVAASGAVDRVFDLRLRRLAYKGEGDGESEEAWCVLPRRG